MFELPFTRLIKGSVQRARDRLWTDPSLKAGAETNRVRQP